MAPFSSRMSIEYLGEKYPFYFDSLKEANEKLNNIDLIRDTHQYLMTFDKRKQITIEYFSLINCKGFSKKLIFL